MSRPSLAPRVLATAMSALLVQTALAASMPSTVLGQNRGDTQELADELAFDSGDRSVWGPGASLPSPFSFDLFEAPFGADFEGSALQSWAGNDFGASVDMTADASIGMRFAMESTSQGKLRVSYPVGARVVFPAPNSFAPGDPVTITTAWSLFDDATLSSEAPETLLGISGPFSASGTVDGKICVFDCASVNGLDFDQSEVDVDFFKVGDAGIGVGDQFLEAERWDFTLVEKFLLGISGYVENPRVYPHATGDENGISASVSQEWLDVNWDLDTFLSRVGVLPGPGGVGLNTGDFAIGYNLYDIDQDLRFVHRRSFDFHATPRVTISFPIDLDWVVKDPGGTEVATGHATEVSLDVGNSLTVTFPSDRTEPLTGDPAYTLPNDLLAKGSWAYSGNLRDTLLSAEFNTPGQTTEEYLHIRDDVDWDFDCDPDTWTQAVCDVAHALSEGAREASDFWNKTVTAVFDWVSHTFDDVDVTWGPAEASQFAQWDATEDYQDASWELEGFGSLDGAGVTLDPEDPSIAVSTSVVSTSLATAEHEGSVTQSIVVDNTGDIRLETLSVLDALGLPIDLIQSYDLTVNAGFDGADDPETLLPLDTLGPGGSAEITVRWPVSPGRYGTTVHAEGTSPISFRTVTDEADVAFGWYAMDVNPDELSRRSNGSLPVDLYGSSELAVSEIDRATLRLEGQAPERIQTTDLNDDGVPDLKLHFDRPAVLASLDARIAAIAEQAGEALASRRILVEQLGQPHSPEEVARALLSGRDFAQDELLAMDRSGNANGRLDIGDLRAALFAGDDGAFLAKKSKDPPEIGPDGAGGGGGGSPDTQVLVLSGALNDGSPLWAEDSATIKGVAR